MTSGYFAPEEETTNIDHSQLDEHRIEDKDVSVDGEAMNEEIADYFERLTEGAHYCFDVAKQARRRGFDPELKPEIPFAEDLASRVEALVGPEDVAERIRELSEKMEREDLALTVSKEIAEGRFGEHDGPESALDQAIRTGLAILTEGILVAPLEGVAEVKIRENSDGTQYPDVYFAGPIRAAGGTGQALSVLIVDVVRRELDLGEYQATDREIERMKEEIPAYKKAANLQHTPGPNEIETIVDNLPVGVNGEGTESDEVSGNRDLPRVETNQLRGGTCLVVAEGLTLKAPKLLKHVGNLGLEGWDFLNQLTKGDDSDNGDDEESKTKIKPVDKFIQELTAGRPVFSHPMAPGGFRLRYGRVRTAGLAATAVHPALTILTDRFLAVGTQLKVERPGKGTIVTPCDEVEPPIARLTDGRVVEIDSVEMAREVVDDLERLVDLGEMLVPYGEFLENNKPLPKSAWCPEWWEKTLEGQGEEVPVIRDAQPALAFAIAEDTDTPLHPRFTLCWHDLDEVDVGERVLSTREAYELLVDAVGEGRLEAGRLVLEASQELRLLLEELAATHQFSDGEIRLDARCSQPVLRGAGYRIEEGELAHVVDLPDGEDPMQIAQTLSGVRLEEKAPCRIGARMGRPEKAAEREMSPPVHGLFPIGNAGGLQRLIGDAAAKGEIGSPDDDAFKSIEVGIRECTDCETETLHLNCPECGARTRPDDEDYPQGRSVPIGDLVEQARERLDLARMPSTVKGVEGLMSQQKLPEPIEKALLRAKHEVSAFKDGTCRHDMTDVTLTQFRPREISTPVEKLREMGYTHDMNGDELTDPGQLVHLYPQDVVVNEDALEYLSRVADFVDDELARLYGIQPHYDLDDPSDLVGHLAVGLAPHTSGGVLCRIVGTTKAAGHFGHPYFHAAKRRNCDGDEDCLMLLLDGLLNFSRAYLPSNRGGQMDAPLTLSLHVDPTEIDGEAHNIECVDEFPLAFYEATREHPGPKHVIEHVEIVEDRLDEPRQFRGLECTHDTATFDEGPALSAYKTIDSMTEKMDGQLGLADRLRAVDAGDVASRVICDHFLPDIVGNLKAFSRQTVRCAKCNSKYRRVPLTGRCRKCKNKLTMTVHEASVKKYIDVAREVAQNYAVDTYTQQRLALIEESIDSLFENDKIEKAQLTDFM